MVEIENVIGGAGGGSATAESGSIPLPQTFYFKIPPNAKLLGYWTTVADRLNKLRHCQNHCRRAAGFGAVRRAYRSRPADRRAGRRASISRAC